MLEPVGQFLNGREVRIEVDHVHGAQIARGVVIDDAAGVQAFDDLFGPDRELHIPQRPRVTGVADAVDHVGIHVLGVAGGVVAHRIHHDRRVALGGPNEELRMAGISIVQIGVGGLPGVMAEMRLRERHEHSHVVRGPQDLGKTQMRARFAAVVVSVDEVDSKAPEALHALAGGLVVRQGGADLGIVERHSRQKDASAVEIEVPTVDPEFPETEPHGPGGVQHRVVAIHERDFETVLIEGRMDIPEPVRHPFLGKCDAACLEIAPLKRRARELLDAAPFFENSRAKSAACIPCKAVDGHIEREFLLSHRGVHSHVH